MNPTEPLTDQSLYIRMRDGIRLALDLHFPAGAAAGQRFPTILRSTRYWRARRPPRLVRWLEALRRRRSARQLGERQAWNQHGYVLARLDARGSGASFGCRTAEWSPAEVADLGEVIDWISAQPWSNGRVGTYGISYDGNAAELAAVPGRPALKAVAPMYGDFDPLFYLALPGGVFNQKFIAEWNRGNQALDANQLYRLEKITSPRHWLYRLLAGGVRPVDADPDGRLLAQAVAGHQNVDVYAGLRHLQFRDQPVGEEGLPPERFSPYGLREAIERSGVPMFVWVSWLDAGTADGALSRFLTFSNPQRVLIGPWSHGGKYNADPFKPARSLSELTVEQVFDRLAGFFDPYLKQDGSHQPERSVTYYTLGRGTWTTTPIWPPEGITWETWHLAPGAGLSRADPGEPQGSDTYRVDFSASSGPANRWETQMTGGDVRYPDRAEADRKLLTYTSKPLPAEAVITGSPVLTLYLASTHTDGALFAYLEDVAPSGEVTYLTEGILRLIHRKVKPEGFPYQPLGPHHSFLAADSQPLTPGEVAEVRLSLYPTSALIRAGHAIRLALAGADAAMFARCPAEGEPIWTVQRNPRFPSRLELPVEPATIMEQTLV